jgi:RNA polymerase sigma-70 factor (ECF subfamily)
MGASLHFMAAAWDDPPTPSDAGPAGRAIVSHVLADHPERALIEAIRAGDRRAFETMYLGAYDALWSFAMRHVHAADAAEDAVHDVFLALWRRRDVWAPQGSVNAYLFTAVRNRVLKQLRHHAVVARAEALEHEIAAIPSASSEEASGIQQKVMAVIATLPERHAMALRLRWQQEMTYPEIAQVLGISPQAARTLVVRVQETLKRLLDSPTE